MPTHLMVADLAVTVHHKKMKHVYLKVLPPDGAVRVSAPHHLSLLAIQTMVLANIDWIKAQRLQLARRRRPAALQYRTGETHLFWGQPYQLNVVPHVGRRHIARPDEQTLSMFVPPTLNTAGRQALLETWYRQQLRVQLDHIIPQKVQQMQVPMPEYRIKKMTTRWGTCNVQAQRIWLNLELIKKAPICLEYVVVHELTHLLERTHNHRFQALMTQFMPDWRCIEQQLQATSDEVPMG